MEANEAVINFENQEKLDAFVNNFPENQHIVMDEDSLRIHCYFRMVEGNYQRTTVQIKKENESLFEVKTSVGGGIILLDKNQTDLFDLEPVFA